DTLWSIAASHYGGDPRDAIYRLEQRNGLTNAGVWPGQRVFFPLRSEKCKRPPPDNRSCSSPGEKVKNGDSSLRPVAATPSHSRSCVAVTRASPQTPCGPITISVSAKWMSGKAVNRPS